MIYLGYDIEHQQHIVCYKDQTLVCRECERTSEIINGLCAVAKKIPEQQPIFLGQQVSVLIKNPWVYTVPYSDKAWSDLLSVAQ